MCEIASFANSRSICGGSVNENVHREREREREGEKKRTETPANSILMMGT
jgi:hypothetical protein